MPELGNYTFYHHAYEILVNSFISEIIQSMVILRVASKFDIFQSVSKLDDAIKISIFQRDNDKR
jgi:hypothetical protein